MYTLFGYCTRINDYKFTQSHITVEYFDHRDNTNTTFISIISMISIRVFFLNKVKNHKYSLLLIQFCIPVHYMFLSRRVLVKYKLYLYDKLRKQ